MSNLSVSNNQTIQTLPGLKQAAKPTAAAQAEAPKSQMAEDVVNVTTQKGGLLKGALTFGGGTLAGAVVGGGAGAGIGALVGGSSYAGTGAAIGLILGGGAGAATGLAVSSMGAFRGEHSVAWGVGAGAAVGALSSIAIPAVVGGGKPAFNPLFAGIFGVIGAAAGGAAAYTAIKASGQQ